MPSTPCFPQIPPCYNPTQLWGQGGLRGVKGGMGEGGRLARKKTKFERRKKNFVLAKEKRSNFCRHFVLCWFLFCGDFRKVRRFWLCQFFFVLFFVLGLIYFAKIKNDKMSKTFRCFSCISPSTFTCPNGFFCLKEIFQLPVFCQQFR